MQVGDVGLVLHDMFIVVLKLGAPALLTATVVGLVISLIQSVTQINEATLAFVPKVLALGAVLMLAGPFMYATLDGYRIGWPAGADNLLLVSVGTGAADKTQVRAMVSRLLPGVKIAGADAADALAVAITHAHHLASNRALRGAA